MSDQVKIGGDSTELIGAIDRAEARLSRFDQTVNGGSFDKGVLERQKKIIDGSGVGVAAAGQAARRSAVDWKVLATERAAATRALSGVGGRQFAPARPGQYLSPAAAEKAEQLEAKAGRAVGGRLGNARVIGDIINIGTASSGAVMRVNALSHVLGSVAPAAGLVAVAAIGYKIYEGLSKAQEEAIALDQAIRNISSASHTSGDFMSTDQVNKGLAEATAKLDEIRARDIDEKQFPEKKFARFTKGVILGKGSFDEQQGADDAKKLELQKSASREIDKLAKKTRDLNHVEYERVKVSEEKAALDKAELNSKERLGLLAAAESAAGVQNPSARNAEKVRAGNEASEIKAKFALIRNQAAFEESIAGLHDRMLTNDQKRLETLVRTVDNAKRLLAFYEKFGNPDQVRTQKNVVKNATNALDEDQQARFISRREDPEGFREREQKEKSDRRLFEATKKDESDRRRRGAYNQTGNLADPVSAAQDTMDKKDRLAEVLEKLFQAGEKQKDGDAPLFSKIDNLVSVITNVGSKLEVAA
jgi:hypothetical protein